MTDNKKYYDELNIFRSLLIIWVAAGHSFEEGFDFLGMLHLYAYTFHMFAFIMLSGLFFAKKLKQINSFKEIPHAVSERFKRLMIPYFFYTAVSIVLKLFLDDYANNKLTLRSVLNSLVGLDNPNGGLWFLYALFILNVFALLLFKLPSWTVLIALVTIKLFMYTCYAYIQFPFIPLVDYIIKYGVYFYLGIVAAEHYEKYSGRLTEFFNRHLPLTGFTAVLTFVLSFGVSIVYKNSVAHWYLQFFIIMINTLTCYCFSLFINALKEIKKPFMTIGKYGMDIYLIGYYIQIALRVLLKSMLGTPYTVYSIAMFVFGLILPIPISKYFVRKFKITRMLALGS